MRLDGGRCRMQIDFLLAKCQRTAAIAKVHRLHAEHAFIKRNAGVDIPDRQNKVVESLNVHGGVLSIQKSKNGM